MGTNGNTTVLTKLPPVNMIRWISGPRGHTAHHYRDITNLPGALDLLLGSHVVVFTFSDTQSPPINDVTDPEVQYSEVNSESASISHGR